MSILIRTLVLLLAMVWATPGLKAAIRGSGDLTYDNLLLKHLSKGMSDEQWAQISAEHLRLWQPSRWQSLERDEEALAAAVAEHQQWLRGAAESAAERRVYTVSERINFMDYDDQLGGFPLQRILRHSVAEIGSTTSIYATQLPVEYRVMVANNDGFDVWPIKQRAAEKFMQERAGMRKRNRYKVFAEADVELLEFQHGHQFQAVIREVRLFANSGDEKPLATIKAPGDVDQRIEDWMLARGVTHKGTPVHQFAYAGFRLNEIIDPFLSAYGECEQRADRDGESHYLCVADADVRHIPVRAHFHVLGGRVAEAEFFRPQGWSEEDLTRIRHDLNVGLARKGVETQWTYGPGILELNQAALQGEEEGPYLRITVSEEWTRDLSGGVSRDR